MTDFLETILVAVLSNFPLSCLALGVLVALVAMARAPRPLRREVVVDKLLAWHVFFAIGVSYLYNFICHVFFGRMTAAYIGWADSPFQFEVGTASLGFALVGFLAAFRSFDLRLAAVLGSAVFLLGAAAGHVWQMVTAHNFAPGNAGTIFYTDIAVPPVGFVLLWLQHRWGRPAA
jgi:hypothetical protein